MFEETESLSEDEENPFAQLHNTNYSEQEFQTEIARLKAASTQRFRQQWESIIERYTAIDPAQSDEIDLATGEVVVDNGHLRSLRECDNVVGDVVVGNIWSDTWDRLEASQRSRQRRERQKKLDLKSRLKETHAFCSLNTREDSSPEKPPLDNLLLVPSPQKRKRRDSMLDDSPSKSSNSLKLDPIRLSPVKRNLDELESPETSPAKRTEFDYHEGYKSIEGKEQYKGQVNGKEDKVQEDKVQEDDDLDSFEEYTIGDISVLGIPTYSLDIYHCAFHTCTYCTGNRLMYQSHLLARHKPELGSLGYPVETSEHVKVTHDEARQLQRVFPLTFTVPSPPVQCTLSVNGQPCRRLFATRTQAQIHQFKRNCSPKVQVLVCPVLGCGYMTDGGYAEWRSHMDAKGHLYEPDYSNMSVGELFSDDGCSPVSPVMSPLLASTPRKGEHKEVKENTDTSIYGLSLGKPSLESCRMGSQTRHTSTNTGNSNGRQKELGSPEKHNDAHIKDRPDRQARGEKTTHDKQTHDILKMNGNILNQDTHKNEILDKIKKVGPNRDMGNPFHRDSNIRRKHPADHFQSRTTAGMKVVDKHIDYELDEVDTRGYESIEELFSDEESR